MDLDYGRMNLMLDASPDLDSYGSFLWAAR